MNRLRSSFFLSIFSLTGFFALNAQEMGFEEYNPPSTLKEPETIVTRAKFPFVDIHSHQGGVNKEKIDRLLSDMKELNMGVLVNLSGRGFGRGDSNSQ